MRLIDADKMDAFELVSKRPTGVYLTDIVEWIEEQPTIDTESLRPHETKNTESTAVNVDELKNILLRCLRNIGCSLCKYSNSQDLLLTCKGLMKEVIKYLEK